MVIAEQKLFSETNDRHISAKQDAVEEYFAWMGRDGVEELQRAATFLRGVPLLQDILDAMPVAVLVLNDKGQIVLMNRHWGRSTGDGTDCSLGKRYGELLGCIHTPEGSDGCGTSAHCADCGAFASILAGRQSQRQEIREYRLTHQTSYGTEVAELIVSSTVIPAAGRNFIVFVVQDTRP